MNIAATKYRWSVEHFSVVTPFFENTENTFFSQQSSLCHFIRYSFNTTLLQAENKRFFSRPASCTCQNLAPHQMCFQCIKVSCKFRLSVHFTVHIMILATSFGDLYGLFFEKWFDSSLYHFASIFKFYRPYLPQIFHDFLRVSYIQTSLIWNLWYQTIFEAKLTSSYPHFMHMRMGERILKYSVASQK